MTLHECLAACKDESKNTLLAVAQMATRMMGWARVMGSAQENETKGRTDFAGALLRSSNEGGARFPEAKLLSAKPRSMAILGQSSIGRAGVRGPDLDGPSRTCACTSSYAWMHTEGFCACDKNSGINNSIEPQQVASHSMANYGSFGSSDSGQARRLVSSTKSDAPCSWQPEPGCRGCKAKVEVLIYKLDSVGRWQRQPNDGDSVWVEGAPLTQEKAGKCKVVPDATERWGFKCEMEEHCVASAFIKWKKGLILGAKWEPNLGPLDSWRGALEDPDRDGRVSKDFQLWLLKRFCIKYFRRGLPYGIQQIALINSECDSRKSETWWLFEFENCRLWNDRTWRVVIETSCTKCFKHL